MTLSLRPLRIARVLSLSGDGTQVVVIEGDRERALPWRGPLPCPGDVVALEAQGQGFAGHRVGGADPGAWDVTGDGMRWRRPNAQGQTRAAVLRQRHAILMAVRSYYEGEGFLEIESPLLVRGTTPDAALDSFDVADRYLTTSTEYQIMRLMTGGFDKVFTLGKNFRRGEVTGRHNPEFTMLEWARNGVPFAVVEDDARNTVVRGLTALGLAQDHLDYQGHHIDLTPPWQRLTVAEVFDRVTGVAFPDFSRSRLRAAVLAAGIGVSETIGQDPSALFAVLADHVQGYLGWDHPVFMHDWPSFQTSSAQEIAGGGLVERSELYIAGLELCNGWPSLTDSQRQKETFALQQARRPFEGKPPVALDERYCEALRQGLPPTASIALGFDRLVMLLTNQTDIRWVLPFAWDEL